jgi:hypothetical protein
MAEDAKADEMTDTLRTSFAESIRRGVPDIPAHHALQMADALCAVQADVLAGLRVTYRARPEVDVEAIAEDWRQGRSIGEIVEKHKVSRSMAYKCHPSKTVRPAKQG